MVEPIVTASARAISVTFSVTHSAFSSPGRFGNERRRDRLGGGTGRRGCMARHHTSHAARISTPTTIGGIASAIFLRTADCAIGLVPRLQA